MWYPVNGGVTPTLHFPGDENGKALTISESPDAAQELSDWSEDSLQLSVQAAVNLGFNVASVDVKGSHKVIVVQAIRYADHAMPNDGVGNAPNGRSPGHTQRCFEFRVALRSRLQRRRTSHAER